MILSRIYISKKYLGICMMYLFIDNNAIIRLYFVYIFSKRYAIY